MSERQKSQTSRDDEMTVLELRQVMAEFVGQRRWQTFHNPKNLTMSLAIETGELLEHFQWLDMQQAAAVKDDPETKAEVGEEIADCLSYLLSLANSLEIDLASTFLAKMEKNRIKYPPPVE